jgi:hypothetical protein
MNEFKNWVIENHIKEEWNDLTNIGKIIVFPFWLIRSVLVWLLLPILLPYYIFINSKIYYKLEGIIAKVFLDMMNVHNDMMNDFNKK